MRNLFVLFVPFLFLFQTANSQTLDWATILGGSGPNNGASVATDSSGNVYSTGLFSGTVDFDPGPNSFNLTSTGQNDIFVLKYDVFGNFIWVKSIGGIPGETVSSITLDNLGNIYITGDFWGTVDFNPGSGTFNVTSSGLNDVFTLKLDASGNFVYAKSLSGTDYNCGNTVAIDVSGNVYTTGFFMGTVDFDPGLGTFNLTSIGSTDIFISKLDASGNFVWAKSMGGIGYDEVRSMVIDSLGNVYTTGNYMSTVDFDPGLGVSNLTSAGSKNIFVSKLDASGNFIWAKSLGGGDLTTVNSIVIDNSCNVYTTGYFRGIADFDPGPGNYDLMTTDSVYYVFISKLNSSGDFLFAKSIGGSTVNTTGTAIGLDNSGNIYTIGSFGESVDFDPGPGSFYITPIGIVDLFILKLDSLGNYLYAKSVGGSGYISGLSLEIDLKGSIYIIGNICCGTFDFDPTIGTYNLTSTNGYTDIFVFKLNQRGASGCIFNDLNASGIKDISEIGLQNRYLTINPGNIIVQTNISGIWSVDSLPVGVYSIIYDTSLTKP